jgi:DNA-directed RNA polymerase specialized sigma24 family protein
MHRSATDQELLAAATSDGDAFAEFYERHARAVLTYATTRLGNVDVGAEVTAETFARALEGLDRYRPSAGSPTAWLFGIARHEVSRTLERGSVERRYRDRLGIADIHLDDDEIERLEARVVHERSYEAIADATGTTPAAARKRVSRALGSLRTKLGMDL